jgi:uncharacterized protein (DUF2336 family)
MFSFFKKLFGGEKYTKQKEQLTSGDAAKLQALASGKDTHPEILYFLAKNESPDIRRAVASNALTPVQAATLLATDGNVDVRLALAARLVELLPGIPPEKHGQLYAYAVQALGMLAQDEVFQVRKALSTTLRDYAKAPPAVVGRLARDVEREVAEPILRYCVALSDDDMLDILSHHPEPWVIATIASRPTVSDKVSHAVVETKDISGTTVLVNNSGAVFSEDTLRIIVESAPQYPEWHKPIALRPEMSLELGRKLAGFVSEAVLSVLEGRSDFDPAMRSNIAAVVKRRLDYAREGLVETPLEKAKRYVSAKALTPDVIQDALAWHETEFLVLALSLMADIHPQVVKKMISLGTAKPVIALCWRAKLPMRLCIEIQKELAKIPPQDLIYAKGGTDYPMSEADIKWQLEFFGVK